MRIGLDVDGVLADFNPEYMRMCINSTAKDLFGPDFIIRTWNYPEEQAGYTKDETTHVWNLIKGSRTFWVGLAPYPQVLAALEEAKRLQNHNGDDIYFITSRVGYKVKEQTEAWLRGMGFANPTVLISHDKGASAKALGLTHYIDDKVENVMSVAVQQPTCLTYLMTQTWNDHYRIPGVRRASSALEFLLDIQQ